MSNSGYLWTSAGLVYLAVVLDLSSRKVVGWSVSACLDIALILAVAALNRAVILRQVTPGNSLLYHSDQGCQYTSHAYQDRLAELGIQASTCAPEGMSRRGNCWESLPLGYNAVMERFFRSLKVEAISRDRYQTQDEMAWGVKNTSISTIPNGYIPQLVRFHPTNMNWFF